MAADHGAGPALTLPQAVLLLALGRGAEPGAVERSLAAAVLLELIERGCMRDAGGPLVATRCPEPQDELLGDALALLRGSLRPREAGWWIERLPSQLAPLRERVARPLIETGIVPHERTLFSGPYGGMRYPERDGRAERRLREQLAAVLLGQRPPLAREALLIALIRPHGLDRGLVPPERAGEAALRAGEVAARVAAPEEGVGSVAAAEAARAVLDARRSLAD